MNSFVERIRADLPRSTGHAPGSTVRGSDPVFPVEGSPKWVGQGIHVVTKHLDDGAVMRIMRGETVEKEMRLGPNSVHAFITHPDGSLTDLGESKNLLTNLGRDWWADGLGFKAPLGGQGSPATAADATSISNTGSVWTASNYGTGPQLGLGGMMVVVPITNITTAPVCGLIGSNTTAKAVIDKWWTPDLAGTGTTPAATNAFYIVPGRGAGALFMALTTDAAVANASTTSLTAELNASGAARAKSTFAHSYAAATFTYDNAYSITGTITAIHKMAMFTCSLLAATGIPVFEAVLNVDATVANLDTLTVTDTVTLSG